MRIMRMRKILLPILFLFEKLTSSLGCLCHVIPNYSCPPPPKCCESAQYVLDECGCCLTCAKAELQDCGGPNDSAGKCSSGLSCLKTCAPCFTIGEDAKPCIFPFIYENRNYESCTNKDAEPGTVWCATSVNASNHVIEGEWGDCSEDCPGARKACDDFRFSIITGKCINTNIPGSIPNWLGAPSYRLLSGENDKIMKAPLCQREGNSQHLTQREKRVYEYNCRCSSDFVTIASDGTQRGNCTAIGGSGNGRRDAVWCFLENIRDPKDPFAGCFDDVTWSSKDGRYWSAKACEGLTALLPVTQSLALSLFESTTNVLKDSEKIKKNDIFHPFNKVENNSLSPVFRGLSDFELPIEKPRHPPTTTATTTTTSESSLLYEYIDYEDYMNEFGNVLSLPVMNQRESNERSQREDNDTTTDPPPIPTSNTLRTTDKTFEEKKELRNLTEPQI